MSQANLAKLITDAVPGCDSQSAYCCQGEVTASDLKLSIDETTPIKLPLRPATFRKLVDASQQAPYGQRTKTLVDTSVRDTLEIDGQHVGLSDDLQAAIDSAAITSADALGLDNDRLQVELYKLLIYPKGGFFAPHRDSEKRRGMVATMIVVLPNAFAGGELIVRHSGQETDFNFGKNASDQAIQYAAFFADCEHEVRKIRSGVRVCLAYNLILQPKSESTKQTKSKAAPPINRALREWTARRPSDPMVVALEHQYTQDGLSPDLLKGADSKLHHALAQAAFDCDYALHFGQVSRHLCQHAEDDSHGYGRYRDYSRAIDHDDLYIGEVYEDEIFIDGWKNEHGELVDLPYLACDASQFVSTIPIEDWVPTSQDYEGYTGNAGNTLDRWYHKSAIVLWPHANSLEVFLDMGIGFAINHLLAMREQLFDTPDEELEEACWECQRTAEAIIDRWPSQLHNARTDGDPEARALKKFADELIRFDDPALIERFLMTVHQRDHFFQLASFIQAACQRIGADVMTPILLRLLRTDRQPNQHGIVFGEGLVARDAFWLAHLCQRKDHGGLTESDLAKFLDAAIDQFQKNVQGAERDRWSRSAKPAPIWVDLCKAALSIDDVAAAERLFKIAVSSPSTFDLRKLSVPAAVELHQWSRKKLNRVSPLMSTWIDGLAQQLGSATDLEPQPPADLARPEVTGCQCGLCNQLSAFLSDPGASTTRIVARKDLRNHVEHTIVSEQLDVQTGLDRSGNTHALILTKTTGSHDRAVTQYKSDLKLLATLKALS